MGLDEEIDEWGRTREIEAPLLFALIRECRREDSEEEIDETEAAIPLPIFEVVTPAV
jgi:hypothetical protein